MIIPSELLKMATDDNVADSVKLAAIVTPWTARGWRPGRQRIEEAGVCARHDSAGRFVSFLVSYRRVSYLDIDG